MSYKQIIYKLIVLKVSLARSEIPSQHGIPFDPKPAIHLIDEILIELYEYHKGRSEHM